MDARAAGGSFRRRATFLERTPRPAKITTRASSSNIDCFSGIVEFQRASPVVCLFAIPSSMKARTAQDVVKFTDIPNVGKHIAADFASLGIAKPQHIKKYNAFTLYTKLSELKGVRQDPCVLDTFIAVVDFMNGAPARPWWYTQGRKKKFPDL